MQEQYFIDNETIRRELRRIFPTEEPIRGVYGIPRGGAIMAQIAATAGLCYLVQKPEDATVILDDIYDSGRTAKEWMDRYPEPELRVVFDKRDDAWKGKWLVFPWEEDGHKDTEHHVVRLLEFFGEDPNRDGLRDTPKRYLKAWGELLAGYKADPKEILTRTFEEDCDEMVICRDIDFHSTCEHHLLPFTGTAHVGYLPSDAGRVVGLSKMARLVDCFARRLQVQEKLTRQVAQAMMEHLQPLGVGVIVVAKHSCMSCRGVQKQNAEMVTSVTLGAFRDQNPVRTEFLNLVNLNKGR
jgi:GTP cyclohydrolase I